MERLLDKGSLQMGKGLLILLSSPSGAGKTTICRKLLAQDPRLCLSVSATTRSPRPQETPGEDYFFLSSETFQAWVDGGAFLEHASVFGNQYGTPREAVAERLARGQDVLFDVDWQGARAISQKMSTLCATAVRIFILPPSLEELEKRLHTRAQDTAAIVQSRMTKARHEISHWAEYDYVLINRDLDETVSWVQSIIQAERLKRCNQPDLCDWVQALEKVSV